MLLLGKTKEGTYYAMMEEDDQLSRELNRIKTAWPDQSVWFKFDPKGLLEFKVMFCGEKKFGCHRPEKLQKKPGACSPKQIRDCLGSSGMHPCAPKRSEKK